MPPAAKVILTDKSLARLAKKPAAPGKRYTVWDALVPGFGVRVSDRGHLSYVLAGRFPGSPHYTQKEIAEVGGATSLAGAREKARDWIVLVRQGKDPKAEEQRQREEKTREQARKKAITFEMVAEAFIEDRVIGPDPERPIQRNAKWTARTIRDPFISTWGNRAVTDISRDDVLDLIRLKKKTAPEEARAQLARIKSLFSWALDQRHGLDRSPASDIKPANVVGEKNARARTLTDTELRALWAAADETPYPVGAFYKLLILSGLRLNELAQASWSEIDMAKRELLIPAARMKGRNSGSDGRKAKPHLVPLTGEMIEVLDSLPRFAHGDSVFTTTGGRKPIHVGSKVKAAIDAKMLAQLRLIAKERGNDPKKVVLEPWVNHDTRRVVRSGLSRLKVPEAVGEAVLAHAKPGISRVYNLHEYRDEKREALEAWAALLREIVTPPAPEPIKGGNVVKLRRKARA